MKDEDWLLEVEVASTRGCTLCARSRLDLYSREYNLQISRFAFFWDIVLKWKLPRFSLFFFLHQHSPQCWCIRQLDCEVHPCWWEDPRKGCLRTSLNEVLSIGRASTMEVRNVWCSFCKLCHILSQAFFVTLHHIVQRSGCRNYWFAISESD